MIRKKDVLIILTMAITHIALSAWVFGTIIGATIVGDTSPDTIAIKIIKIIILSPYTPLYMIPPFQYLDLWPILGIMALYSLLFNTAIYFILRKITWTIKNSCKR